jgi:hypothetical protein
MSVCANSQVTAQLGFHTTTSWRSQLAMVPFYILSFSSYKKYPKRTSIQLSLLFQVMTLPYLASRTKCWYMRLKEVSACAPVTLLRQMSKVHDTTSSVLTDDWSFIYLKAGNISVWTEDWHLSYLISFYEFQYLHQCLANFWGCIAAWLSHFLQVWGLLDISRIFTPSCDLQRYSFNYSTLIH